MEKTNSIQSSFHSQFLFSPINFKESKYFFYSHRLQELNIFIMD